MSFYRGFIEVKDKVPVSKYAGLPDSKLLSEEEAKRRPEYAGVLSQEAVCLDWDKEEEAEAALAIIKGEGVKCRVIKTKKGIHALFLNDGEWESTFTNKPLCCGLFADCKLGVKNGLECLKDSSGQREVIYDTKEYGPPPFFFRQAKTKEEERFCGLGDGSGRNDKLFRWILVLQKSMEKEEAKMTIEIINSYVFSDPLPPSEIDAICRDESFKNGAKKKKKDMPGAEFFSDMGFDFSAFALHLMNKIKIIRINKNLHIFKEGVYVQGKEEIERAMIREIPTLSQSRRNEVFAYLNLVAENFDDAYKFVHLIPFKNGVLNIMTGELEPFNDEHILTNKINYNYNPAAYFEIGDNMLNKVSCGNQEVRALIEEMIGSCFFRSNKLAGGKAFILTGDKSNGKSTILDVIKNLVGKDNYSSLDFRELGDRFNKAIPFGKLVNIGDDIKDDYIDDSSIFKKMATGEDISAERKGQDGFSYTATCKLMFASNNLPKIRDRTGAVKRRLLIVPFNARFSPQDPDFDPMIGFKLMTEQAMEYFIKVGVDGLLRVVNNNKYTEPKIVKEAVDAYDKDNNPIRYFLEELDFDLDILMRPTSSVYNKYKVFCMENNLHPMSNIEFSKIIRREFNVQISKKRVDGECCRIFVK